jgi:hypothetical protein
MSEKSAAMTEEARLVFEEAELAFADLSRQANQKLEFRRFGDALVDTTMAKLAYLAQLHSHQQTGRITPSQYTFIMEEFQLRTDSLREEIRASWTDYEKGDKHALGPSDRGLSIY